MDSSRHPYDDAADAATRELPHSIEAEQALLGAILVNNRSLDRVTDTLETAHFYDPLHGRLFDVMRDLIEGGKLANPTTISPSFVDHPEITKGVTINRYLGTLAAHATSTMYARDYATTIRDYAVRRNLITIGETMVHDAYVNETDAPAKSVIEAAELGLYELAEKGTYGSGSRSITDIFNDVLEDANTAYLAGGKPVGIMTGFKDLDDRLSGLAPGNLIIIGGRPSMGKTALAVNIADNIAKAGIAVQFDSMEMSSKELGLRLLAEHSAISSQKIKRGSLSEDELRTTIITARAMHNHPLFIDDAGGLTIGKLAARARRIKRQRHIGCLIIDYLQLMAGKGSNRVNDVTEITTGLKALAKDLQIPIIALSQLSRAVENRDDKRPQLSDLRDSGSIEQDADVVLFVYREEYYVERTKPDDGKVDDMIKWQKAMGLCRGKAEVIIAKQRHGSVGIVPMAFDAVRTRFLNLATDYQAKPWQERDQ